MEAESDERRGCPTSLLSLLKPNHLKLRLKPLRVSKANLTFNQNILESLNVSTLRSLDNTLQSVQKKRIMVMIDNGDVEFKSDKSDCEDMPPLKECAEDEVALPIEESLVIRRTL